MATTHAEPFDGRLRGSPAEGLWGATLGFFFGFAAVALFGPTAAKFKDAMNLSPVLVGLLVAMPSLSGSLLRIPFAAWVDTTGGRRPFLVLMVLSIVGMAGLLGIIWFFYPDRLTLKLYPLLLLFGLLCGCGIATFSVGIGQVSYWFPQSKQGAALGTYAGLGNLAPGMFSFLLPLALKSWGLTGAYLAWLLFLIIGTAVYAYFGRNAWYFQLVAAGQPPERAREIARARGQELFPASSLTESLKISAQKWKTWLLVAIYFTTFGGFIALTAWFPTYWKESFQTTVVIAGALTATYSILASLIRVAGGAVADRLGGEPTGYAALTLMLVGAILLTLSPQFAVAVAGAILMAIGMGVTNAVVFKLVPREVPDAVGGAAGWVGGLGAFGGFAIPPVMGWFVKELGPVGYARGFVVFVGLAVLSLVFLKVIGWSHRSALLARQTESATALES